MCRGCSPKKQQTNKIIISTLEGQPNQSFSFVWDYCWLLPNQLPWVWGRHYWCLGHYCPFSRWVAHPPTPTQLQRVLAAGGSQLHFPGELFSPRTARKVMGLPPFRAGGEPATSWAKKLKSTFPLLQSYLWVSSKALSLLIFLPFPHFPIDFSRNHLR